MVGCWGGNVVGYSGRVEGEGEGGGRRNRKESERAAGTYFGDNFEVARKYWPAARTL